MVMHTPTVTIFFRTLTALKTYLATADRLADTQADRDLIESAATIDTMSMALVLQLPATAAEFPATAQLELDALPTAQAVLEHCAERSSGDIQIHRHSRLS